MGRKNERPSELAQHEELPTAVLAMHNRFATRWLRQCNDGPDEPRLPADSWALRTSEPPDGAAYSPDTQRPRRCQAVARSSGPCRRNYRKGIDSDVERVNHAEMTKTASKFRCKAKLLRPAATEGRLLDLSYPAKERQCEALHAGHDNS